MQPVFVGSGTWFSTVLDSAIGRCQWHRVVLDLKLPAGTALSVSTTTSEVAQPDALIQALPRIADMAHAEGLYAERTTAALMASEDESRVRIAEFLNRKRS